MKISNTIVAALAITTLLGGAGFAYNQAFASNLDEQPTTSHESTSTYKVNITSSIERESTPKETPEYEAAKRKKLELKDIDKVNIPLNLHTSSGDHTMSTAGTENNSIIERTAIHASENMYGKEVYVTYRLSGGQEIFISQSEDVLEHEQATLELAKSWYKPDEVSTQELNGATAVIEDGETRKTVHLITDDNFYTICSNGADNLDQLIQIANGIQP
ncbi:hypothetical protein [Paenibacillus sp. MER 99-2]|uniref:hypothetical protein n=1 Tax=Paenibacillus sp. MER 99-2 TaxID=2939572 RepID=UPI00203C5B15|nr:hypothetical protein [Paenibacillus sp. MER 99-2]MCM3172462.1 hypothetical protein [Paenibacillus sp. MER 99-2]